MSEPMNEIQLLIISIEIFSPGAYSLLVDIILDVFMQGEYFKNEFCLINMQLST